MKRLAALLFGLSVVAAMLRMETGRDPDLDALLAGGYEALRPCLADGTH